MSFPILQRQPRSGRAGLPLVLPALILLLFAFSLSVARTEESAHSARPPAVIGKPRIERIHLPLTPKKWALLAVVTSLAGCLTLRRTLEERRIDHMRRFQCRLPQSSR